MTLFSRLRHPLVSTRDLWSLLNRLVSGLDAGMSTAEYAVGTVAAVAFAAVLYKVVRSGSVSDALSSLVTGALHAL